LSQLYLQAITQIIN